ncbi:MAG: riboflavin synthase [Coriobacteriia bacterium]
MFTGLVECKGIVTRVERVDGGMRLEIYAPEFGRDMAIGDSVAIDGVCLTVVKFIRGAFLADVSQETMERTTLGRLHQGMGVNLERALRLSDRLGGHLVTGHVDAVGQLVNRRPAGNSAMYQFRAPSWLLRYLAPKGSVAVDGVSLTVADLLQDGFSAAVVPHTEEVTTLREKPIGAEVNLEIDLIARYVARLLGSEDSGRSAPNEPSRRKSLGDMLRELSEGG